MTTEQEREQPIAYALLRDGKVEGVERTLECAKGWVNAEIRPLVFATKPAAPAVSAAGGGE